VAVAAIAADLTVVPPILVEPAVAAVPAIPETTLYGGFRNMIENYSADNLKIAMINASGERPPAMASSLPTALSSQGYDSLLLADTPLAPTVAAERPSIANITPLGGPSQEEFIDNNWINAMLVAVESALQNFE
jgi:hypothetical protein